MANELTVEEIDLEYNKNSKNHKTYGMCQKRLVVRRGQPFHITIYFHGRGFEASVDKLYFIVETGPRPNEVEGTKAKFALTDSLQEGTWAASVVGQEGNQLSLTISSPAHAPIGFYKLSMETTTESHDKTLSVTNFILLFNPWCQEDAVYMEKDDFRREYVLNQNGIIFQGSCKRINTIPWNFGQFEDGIIDICFALLDMNPKFFKDPGRDCSRRNNPIYISRVISAMVNCNDDKGILYGRWDNNNYEEGISPMEWIGSVDILRRWKKSGCLPVKYGQCWVFAAVACTVFRCLGIPARVITNFNSAHDSNANLSIEIYRNEKGEMLKNMCEMIWNYHCWTEVWMTRPDLKQEFNGWQALDPTPQEKSEGTYCCGPASVKAIKSGEVNTKYDAPFVFAEINADVAEWINRQDGSNERLHTTTSIVGLMISTKAVGSDQREDITHHYKHPEGSMEERETYKKANHLSKLASKEEHPEEIQKIRIKVSPDMNKGNDFDVFGMINNISSEEQKYWLLLSARTVSYNGRLGPECSKKEISCVTVEPLSEIKIPLRINYSNYSDHLTESNLIKVKMLLQHQETRTFMMAERDIYLMNPDINIRILGEPKKNRKLVAELSVKNPLQIPLFDCVFTVEGAGLIQEQKRVEISGPVEPESVAKTRVDLMPRWSGLHKLVVNFESDKLKAVKGHRNVIIGK